MADRSQITRNLLILSSLPNCPIKDGNLEIIIDAYHIVLKDLPGEDVQAATVHYLSRGTFFPTPGQLRRTVMDLRLSASGIPTAAEAWADVGHALRYIDAYYCPEGERLRDMALDAEKAYDGAGYIRALKQYSAHTRTCTECWGARTEEVYPHPAVEQTVRRLGGREALFTDNAAADRARFIEAYEIIIGVEREAIGRLPEVERWVEELRGKRELERDAREELKRLAEKK
jgi:hypothetical protein